MTENGKYMANGTEYVEPFLSVQFVLIVIKIARTRFVCAHYGNGFWVNKVSEVSSGFSPASSSPQADLTGCSSKAIEGHYFIPIHMFVYFHEWMA